MFAHALLTAGSWARSSAPTPAGSWTTLTTASWRAGGTASPKFARRWQKWHACRERAGKGQGKPRAGSKTVEGARIKGLLRDRTLHYRTRLARSRRPPRLSSAPMPRATGPGTRARATFLAIRGPVADEAKRHNEDTHIPGTAEPPNSAKTHATALLRIQVLAFC